ncbi:MAG: hypothetical protein V7642_4534, partial [Burkholderiales bacterium]
GAGEESRTLDLNLGKVALYQLSYSRVNDKTRIIEVSKFLSSMTPCPRPVVIGKTPVKPYPRRSALSLMSGQALRM